MGFGGVGALIAAWLAAGHGWPFELALLAGVLAAIPVGVVIGLAGIRTRGVSLAIVTLGLAVSLEAVVFDNPQYTGGLTGWQETNPTFFGVSVSPSAYPARYATLSLIVVVLVGLAVANLRRGRAGRRLIAVRTNERAAASLGVSVLGAKLYAFVLGAMIAALGGVLLAFSQPVLSFGNFAAINSVLDTQYAVLGGVGTVGGPLAGSGLAPGSLGQSILSFLGGNVAIILGIVAGGGLLALLVFAPDGVAAATRDLNDWWLSRLRRRLPGRRGPGPADDAAGGDPRPVPPMALRVTDLTVRFGGTTALDRLNLTIHPGEVVGLIGPNGAGKSTAIEAITGFVSPAAGTIMLGDHRIEGWTRERRARAGLSRSFQTLELFDDLTVLENILAASDPRDLAAYLTDLVKPGTGRLTPAARRAIADFGLRDVLPAKVLSLSYAERRTLAVARAVAGGQSVLLLDEPASGLDLGAWRQLSRTIRGLASDRGVAILLVEHNVDMVLQTCDRIWALDFGQTIACGTPAEIRTDPAVITAYLGTKRFEQPDPLPRREPNQPSGSIS
jgi:ABC-type branched-subunit amino acid transport system ATPase component/ABC-type branched-subunit amino acid transport system permease subunit